MKGLSIRGQLKGTAQNWLRLDLEGPVLLPQNVV
jgi:hypothetical protein